MFENKHSKLNASPRGIGRYEKVISNIGWLFFERIIRAVGSLIVGVWIARYLGPKQLGILSYALSIMAFFSVFVYLGLSGIVVRDIIKYPDESNLLLGTTFSLKVIGSIIAYIVVALMAVISYGHNSLEFWVLIVVGLSLFLRPFDTINFWFESQVQAKYSTFSKSVAFVLSSVIKIILILLSAPLIAFALVSFVEGLIATALLILAYRLRGYSIFSWRANFIKAKELLNQSWILILSSFMATVYLKIDQVMLQWMIGPQEVGIYSVAVLLSEAWYFVPLTIVASISPGLTKQKNENENIYNNNLQKIYDILFILALSLAIPITFLSETIISLLYGEAYIKAGAVLMVHIWAGIFIFMRALFSRWMIIEGLLKYSFYSHCLGAVLNILLNLLLIGPYGSLGAAVATLISYASASYFALFFNKKTWGTAKMMSLSLIFPFRLLIYGGKVWKST